MAEWLLLLAHWPVCWFRVTSWVRYLQPVFVLAPNGEERAAEHHVCFRKEARPFGGSISSVAGSATGLFTFLWAGSEQEVPVFLCRTASDLHMLLQLLLGLPISFLCRWRLCCLVFSNVPVRASSHFQCGRAARIQWYVGSEPAKSILKTQKNQINFLYETGEVIFCWLYIQMHSS